MKVTPEDLKRIIKESINESINEKKEEKISLTIDEAVLLSGIGKNKLCELMNKQNTDFPYFKVGVKYMINRHLLIDWLSKIAKEGRIL